MGDSIRTSSELTPQNLPALGARVVYEIPRTSDLEQISVLFTGSFELTTAANALITDGVLNIITAVELLANSGRDVIISAPLNILVQGNMFRRRKGSVPVIAQPGVAAAVNAFSVAAILDLSAYGTIRPKDSSLRENNYESLQLAFRFAGDVTGVYTGGGFVNTNNVLNLAVAVKETVELADPKTQVTSNPVARPLVTSNDVIIAGASNKVQFKLTPGQGLRGICLKVQSNANPPVLSDTLLSRTRVNVGKVNRLDKAGTTIKAEMSVNYHGNSAAPVGYYYMDFAERQGANDHLNDVLNLDPSHTNGADSIIEFDTSGPCTISVLQLGVIPLAS